MEGEQNDKNPLSIKKKIKNKLRKLSTTKTDKPKLNLENASSLFEGPGSVELGIKAR